MNAICGRVAPCWSSSKTRTSVGGAGLKRAVAGGRRLGNNTHGGRAKKLEVRAGENPESSVSMDYKGALKFLGLSENASSEDMVRAKNQMLSRYEDQEEKLKTVESAYDVVLMKSLMKRSMGEVSDNRVKYADVLSPGATVKQKLPPWARDLTNKLPPRPAFESPNSETLTQSGIALGVLAALVLAQGCTQPPGMDDPPGLQLSLALFGSVWLLRKKNLTLGRSISLAVLGLTVGSMVGGIIQGWLRVDIVPLGALSSPSAVVSEFSLVGIFAATAFLY